jgi:hypothetical protein
MSPLRQQINSWLPAIVAFGLVAIVLVTAFAMFVTGADSDDFSSYLEATATTLALIAATIAAWHAWGVFQLESKREDRLADDRRSAQASLIAAWILDPVVNHVDEFGDTTGRPALLSIVVAINNASVLPVTSVRVKVALAVETGSTGSLSTDGDLGPRVIAEESYSAIGPYHQFHKRQLPLFRPIALTDPGFEDETKLLEMLQISIEFRDAANRRWQRSFAGVLEELGTST